MVDKKFQAILVILIPQLVKEIVDNEKLSEQTATINLYKSELYASIEDESTKLWHLSPKALYELYKEEMETGKIIYPEA